MSTPPPIISPTLDTAYVESAKWLVTELTRDGFPLKYAAELTTQYLEDVVHAHGVSASFAESLVDPDYDPTDAELERSWNGPDAHEAHRAAWTLHQEVCF